jgi:hypothetical protein
VQNAAFLLILGALAFLIYSVRAYLPAYIRRKAENLAQKEDLRVLTDITERIRSQFDKVNVVHRIQFEAEFRHYQDLWRALHMGWTQFVRLFPVNRHLPQPDQSIFDSFLAAQLQYAQALDDCKPFIPEDIWGAFHEFDLMLIEAKARGLSGTAVTDVREYRKEVRKVLEGCAEKIRTRLATLLVV